MMKQEIVRCAISCNNIRGMFMTDKMLDLTITIVSYHNEEDVKCAVESIERFTPADIKKHIFVVDNTDKEAVSEAAETKINTESLLLLEQQYADVTCVATGKNLGFGGGHNFVLKDLNSRFHAIVNPDIILREDAFSALLTFMQDESIGMCVPRLTDEDGELLSVYRRELTVWDMFLRMFLKGAFKKRQAHHTMQDADYSRPFDVPFAQGSFLLIRTELFKKLNGFDERFFLYMEDADLCKRVNAQSRLVYCPYATVVHKWERGSHKNGKLFKLHVQSMIAYFSKWHWKLF